ncbi:MAG: hypothetical protein WDN04_05110 [Rhodospirillales bacterium]
MIACARRWRRGCRPARATFPNIADAIKTDALGMKADLERAGLILAENPYEFGQVLVAQTTLRGLDEAFIYRPDTGEVWWPVPG